MAQKAKLIVDDFRDNIAGRLGGRAKAMVVTGSRKHALALYQAIRKYVEMRGFTDLRHARRVLRAARRTTALEFTEAQLNGFPERQLPDRFGYTKADDPQAAARNQDEYRLLVAADKYQTGFDQPLLCAMYVDKPLTGVAAVQTLSRLNRIHPLKSQDDVHILDFANEAERHPGAVRALVRDDDHRAERPEPALRQAAGGHGLRSCWPPRRWRRSCGCWPAAGRDGMPEAAERKLHAELHEYLKPALDRFGALETDDEREDFRGALQDSTSAPTASSPRSSTGATGPGAALPVRPGPAASGCPGGRRRRSTSATPT